MKNVRLKTSLEEQSVLDRLQYQPEIIEFHLFDKDLEDLTLIKYQIERLQRMGIKVYLHHPMKIGNKVLDIMSSDREVKDFYWQSAKILTEICKSYQIRCVVHAHYANTESSNHLEYSFAKEMKEEIQKVEVFSKGLFLWEDTIEGMFSYHSPHLIDEIIKPLHLDLNVDISHSFISLKGDNDKLMEILKQTKSYAKYYHVVDSKGQVHDGLPLGEGLIDWKRVKPYIEGTDFVFEISLSDVRNCKSMIDSLLYYNKI